MSYVFIYVFTLVYNTIFCVTYVKYCQVIQKVIHISATDMQTQTNGKVTATMDLFYYLLLRYNGQFTMFLFHRIILDI